MGDWTPSADWFLGLLSREHTTEDRSRPYPFFLASPLEENGPARVFAAVGTVQELVASRVMEHRMGLVREAYEHGQAHRLGQAAEVLNVAGLLGTVFLAGRSRAGAAASGLALLAGSALQRFRVFDAGVESTKDPKYVVVPQRERLDARA